MPIKGHIELSRSEIAAKPSVQGTKRWDPIMEAQIAPVDSVRIFEFAKVERLSVQNTCVSMKNLMMTRAPLFSDF